MTAYLPAVETALGGAVRGVQRRHVWGGADGGAVRAVPVGRDGIATPGMTLTP